MKKRDQCQRWVFSTWRGRSTVSPQNARPTAKNLWIWEGNLDESSYRGTGTSPEIGFFLALFNWSAAAEWLSNGKTPARYFLVTSWKQKARLIMRAEQLGALNDSLSVHLVALKSSGFCVCVELLVLKLGRRSDHDQTKYRRLAIYTVCLIFSAPYQLFKSGQEGLGRNLPHMDHHVHSSYLSISLNS